MIGVGLSIPQIAGSSTAFNPLKLFAAGEQGVWYDPSDFSTMFQNSAGSTSVTAVGQPVGLILDKSKGLALGSEIVTNGGFDNDVTGWTAGGTGTIVWSAGQAVFTRAVSGDLAYQAVTTTSGKFYKISVTVASGNNARMSFHTSTSALGSGNIGENKGVGTYTAIIQATASTMYLQLCAAANVSITYDNVTVKELAGNHASQGTSASRPTLQQEASGQYYLAFDGTDDSLATPSIDFSATDKMTVHAGVRKVSDAAQAMVVELSSSLGTNNGTFALQAPRTTSAGRFSFVAKGTGSGTVDADAAANASPVTAVLTSQMDIAGDATSLRVNGVSAGTSVADLGTGNLGNYPLYIGRRGGSTLPFNGRLYSLIVRGAASTNAQIVGAEKWVNGKTGAY